MQQKEINSKVGMMQNSITGTSWVTKVALEFYHCLEKYGSCHLRFMIDSP